MGATSEAYKSLARFFAGTDNPKKAIFFFDKCLDVASKAGDAGAEMEANANLGGAHESTGNVAAAVAAFERQTRLAETSGDDGELRVGRANLVRVYRAAADRRAASGDAEGGVAFLEKCLEVAKLDGSNPTAEGLANHRLGLAHLAAGQHEKARRGVYYVQGRRLLTPHLRALTTSVLSRSQPMKKHLYTSVKP